MDEKRSQIIKWFDVPKPSFPVFPALIGVLFALCGGGALANDSGAAGAVPLLIGLAAIGGAWAVYSSRSSAYNARPSDQEMDAWIEEDLKAMDRQALNKTGLDEVVGDAVVITGPRFWDVSAAIKYRKGGDGVLRFSPMNVTVLNFTKDQVVAYSCALDLTTGKPLNEGTDEYFYKDVVSVSTKTKSVTYNTSTMGTLQLTSAETFELTTSGGTSISVVLRDPSLVQRMGGGEIPNTRAEKAIATVRKMLREKKGA